jgi:copper resistance protein B
MIDSLKRPALLALAVTLATAGSAQAAEAMDHGQMDHSQMQHGQMDHGAMDHRQMNHGQMDHGSMDHSKMNHGQMDHGSMDHSKMDHGSMDHSKMDHGQKPQPAGYGSRTPIPVPTDADRAAAFPDLPPHTMHAGGINSFFLLDQLEYQDADDASVLSWDASGWIGRDINRFWFRSEGERANGKTEEAEVQALYGRAV